MHIMRIACVMLCMLATTECKSLNDSSQCYHIVGNLTGSDKAIASAEASVVSSLALFPVYISFGCARALRNFLCLGTYTNDGLILTSLGAKATLCSDMCDFVSEECDDLLSVLPSDSIEGAILEYEIAAGCSDTVECLSPNKTVYYADDVPECPYPLVVPESSDPSIAVTGTGCALPCPTYFLTDSEWDSFFILYAVVSYIGFFASGYMIVRTLIEAQADGKQKPGAWNVFMFSLGCFIVSIGAIMFNISQPRKQICANNAKSDTYNPACVAQGYLYAFGSTWATAWGCCSSFEVYMKIVRKANKVEVDLYRRWYMPFAVSIALYSVILGASTSAIGYEIELNIPCCFFFANSKTWVQWAAWYAPVTAMGALTLVFMVSTMVVMTRVLLETSEPVTQSDIGDRNPHSLHIRRKEQLGKVIQYNIRPFLFVVVFLLVMFYLLGFRYYAEATKSVLTNSTTEHITCLLTEGTYDASQGTAKCGVVPKKRFPYAVYAFLVTFLSAYSLVPLVVYGINYQYECSKGIKTVVLTLSRLSKLTLSQTSDTQNNEYVKSSLSPKYPKSSEERPASAITNAMHQMDTPDHDGTIVELDEI